MLKTLKTMMLSLMLAFSLSAPALVPATAYADVAASRADACAGIGLSGGSCGGASANKNVGNLLSTIVRILSVVVGIAAVVMIIVSGFKYVTSGGDANKVGSAKTSLIYAVVGLIVVALAQFIVKFVLEQV